MNHDIDDTNMTFYDCIEAEEDTPCQKSQPYVNSTSPQLQAMIDRDLAKKKSESQSDPTASYALRKLIEADETSDINSPEYNEWLDNLSTVGSLTTAESNDGESTSDYDMGSDSTPWWYSSSDKGGWNNNWIDPRISKCFPFGSWKDPYLDEKTFLAVSSDSDMKDESDMSTDDCEDFWEDGYQN